MDISQRKSSWTDTLKFTTMSIKKRQKSAPSNFSRTLTPMEMVKLALMNGAKSLSKKKMCWASETCELPSIFSTTIKAVQLIHAKLVASSAIAYLRRNKKELFTKLIPIKMVLSTLRNSKRWWQRCWIWETMLRKGTGKALAMLQIYQRSKKHSSLSNVRKPPSILLLFSPPWIKTVTVYLRDPS